MSIKCVRCEKNIEGFVFCVIVNIKNEEGYYQRLYRPICHECHNELPGFVTCDCDIFEKFDDDRFEEVKTPAKMRTYRERKQPP